MSKKILIYLFVAITGVAAMAGSVYLYENFIKEKREDATMLYIPEREFDFGIVKQSGGVVSHDFAVTNISKEKVTIEALVGSCACTSGKYDKKEILPSEKAVITVMFDANLHEEPKGKFFKTLEIFSNVFPHPELKIYAEVDEDLGPKYYKLQIKD